MSQLRKRFANYHRVPQHFSKYVESSAKQSFSRLIAINTDLNLMFPFVDGRRLSDVEAMARGFVPDVLQNKVRSFWRSVSPQLDNKGVSDADIAKQVRLHSVGVEASERMKILEDRGLFSVPPAPAPEPPTPSPDE